MGESLERPLAAPDHGRWVVKAPSAALVCYIITQGVYRQLLQLCMLGRWRHSNGSASIHIYIWRGSAGRYHEYHATVTNS